jgi:hypothetical protein
LEINRRLYMDEHKPGDPCWFSSDIAELICGNWCELPAGARSQAALKGRAWTVSMAVVIGAGVVGLAVARALALSPRFAGAQMLVHAEAADAIGTGTSSRNSEVIHAGIYYPAGLAQGQAWCVQGRQQLYAYCAERGVAHRRCGKLIVATDEAQTAQLEAIAAQGRGQRGGRLCSCSAPSRRARWSRPCSCTAALHLAADRHQSTAMRSCSSLQGDFENAGGIVALHGALALRRLTATQGITLHMARWQRFETRRWWSMRLG